MHNIDMAARNRLVLWIRQRSDSLVQTCEFMSAMSFILENHFLIKNDHERNI
jgi:hypothetical protein